MTIYVSATSLNEYISCEYKTYFKFFAQLEPGPPNREMLMGSIAHKVIEKAWDDRNKAIQMAIRKSNENKLDEVSINSVLHFVNTYFDHFKIMVRPDDKIEKRFKVKLTGDVYLVGVFDRVTMGTVIDWKTNANPPKRIDNNVQFIIYDMAYKLLYNKPAEGLYLASLKDGSLVRYKESKEHVDAVTTQVIPQYVEAIRNETFIKRGLFNGSCYRCLYKQPCLGDTKNELVHSATFEE